MAWDKYSILQTHHFDVVRYTAPPHDKNKKFKSDFATLIPWRHCMSHHRKVSNFGCYQRTTLSYVKISVVIDGFVLSEVPSVIVVERVGYHEPVQTMMAVRRQVFDVNRSTIAATANERNTSSSRSQYSEFQGVCTFLFKSLFCPNYQQNPQIKPRGGRTYLFSVERGRAE